jgi:signal transduction histidine kinase/HAMP domain-containing protein
MFGFAQRFFNYFDSRIRFKVIFPFAILTLTVAIIGAFLSTRLISGSLEERFTRQLVEAASIATDVLAQRETEQVEKLRRIAFTEGLDRAVVSGDREALELLLFPIVGNERIHRVDILDAQGRQLLSMRRPPGSRKVEDYLSIPEEELEDWSDWPIIQKVLSEVVDAQGDKFVTLREVDNQLMFLTAGPIKQEGVVIGVVAVSSYSSELLRNLAQSTFAEISIYDIEGRVIDTTFPADEETKAVLALGARANSLSGLDGQWSLRRSISLEGREYDLIYGLLQARGELLGFYSVGLQTEYIESYGTVARNQMFFIFGATLVLVFLVGYFTAQLITGRLQHLMENAMAVAQGDFSRRTHISSKDEIGSLARSLDEMTESLAKYTASLQNRIDELIVLYESSTAVTVKSGLNLDHVTQAIAASIHGVIRGTDQVVVHLLDQKQNILTPRAAAPVEAKAFPKLAFNQNGPLYELLTTTKPKVVSLAEIERYALQGGFSVNGISHILVAPLVVGQEMIGMLTVMPAAAQAGADLLNDDSERLLATLANQAAIAVKNAQLFETTREAYKELQKLDDLKTEFINIAAHELRTPLGAMIGYASFIEKRVPPKLHKPTRFLMVSSLRMRTMVDAMLAIQRLDAGTAFLHITSIDIRDILKKAATDFQPMAELEGHVIEVHLPDKLGLIQADAEKVGLILSNLVSNALKFTPEGGRIEITAQDYIKGVLISVRDNGVGISPEDQERIFERFYQARPEHIAGHGGMGIGLTIVKHLVELHEGQIWVESEPGKGSTFSFTLPRLEEVDDGAAPPPLNGYAPPQQKGEKSLEFTY